MWQHPRAEISCIKGAGMMLKYKGFMYSDKTNVKHEMYDYIGDDWSHRNSNKMFKKTWKLCREDF
jgi:hypothetical protein